MYDCIFSDSSTCVADADPSDPTNKDIKSVTNKVASFTMPCKVEIPMHGMNPGGEKG